MQNLQNIDIWLALGVVVATALTDAVYVMFTSSVIARKRVAAANWSSLWYTLSSFAVISYTNNWVYVLFAAASMPADKVAFLGRTIAGIMATPEMQAKFHASSMTPVSATPEETARMIAAFRARWEPVIRAAKLEQ